MPSVLAINALTTQEDILQRPPDIERFSAAATLMDLRGEDFRIHREIQDGLTRSITEARAAVELRRSMAASMAEEYARDSKIVKREFQDSESIDEESRPRRIRLIVKPPTPEQLRWEAEFLATQQETPEPEVLPITRTKDPRRSAPTESFGFNLKKWLNSWSNASDNQKASDYAPYERVIASHYPNHDPINILDRDYDGDVKKPRNAPVGNEYGDASGLKTYEAALCHKLKITYAQYRCAKARLFIGLACFIEYNSRGLDDSVPKQAHQTSSSTTFKSVGFKVTQGQMCNKLDGNVTGPLTKVFHRWGWIDESLVEKDDLNGQIRVRRDLEEKFPATFRTRMFRELIAWENSEEMGLEEEQKFAFRRLEE